MSTLPVLPVQVLLLLMSRQGSKGRKRRRSW